MNTNQNNGLYLIDTGYACAGIEVMNDRVILAAPIFKWMTGKLFNEIKAWKKIKSIKPCQ